MTDAPDDVLAGACPVAGTDAAPFAARIDPRWKWHYRTLIALRDRLSQDTGQKFREAAEPIEAHSMHAADSGTDEFEHDMVLTLLDRKEHALRDVNDAIIRILEGRYGVCGITGAAIPASRLRALPWCRYSVEAERELERANGKGRYRVPNAVSLRGGKSDLPGTGTITREDSEGPSEEPHERDEASRVIDESTPSVADFDGPEEASTFHKLEKPV